MRAKLLVTAVALGNLALGLTAGVVLGRRSAEPEPQQASPAPSELAASPGRIDASPDAAASPSTAPVSTEVDANPAVSPVTSRRGRRHHHRRGRGRRGGPEFMLRHLQQAVDMDAEQVKAAEAILSRGHERVGQLLKGVRPKMHQIQAETHAELRALLRPEQREKLDALKAAMERRGPPWRWDKNRRGKHGPESGPRGGRDDRWGRWGGRRGREGGSRDERGPGGEREGPRGERGGPRGERGGPRGERGPRHPRPEGPGGPEHESPEDEVPAETPDQDDAPAPPSPSAEEGSL